MNKVETTEGVDVFNDEFFEEEGQERLRDLTTILEPAIIVGMGLIVGLLVIAIMMPMFDMATLSNSR